MLASLCLVISFLIGISIYLPLLVVSTPRDLLVVTVKEFKRSLVISPRDCAAIRVGGQLLAANS